MNPFEIELQGVSVFPKWKKPRVLFVGVSEGSSSLKSLINQLEKRWKEAGIPPPKTANSMPHFTLGRWSDLYVKPLEGDLVKDAAASFIKPIARFQVTEALMVSSSLEPDQPVYTPIHFAKAKNSIPPIRTRAKYQPFTPPIKTKH
eukprot:TRINITY_DN355_c0_g1_i1.p1 TRINITY_DN355_c0_g1~~TRINITY_DN355_c0_g1_i1.p1  ORF type:complete len:146 (-),score=34.65 TRINITY_DN355_c0_g1_i1:19-456(-)